MHWTRNGQDRVTVLGPQNYFVRPAPDNLHRSQPRSSSSRYTLANANESGSCSNKCDPHPQDHSLIFIVCHILIPICNLCYAMWYILSQHARRNITLNIKISIYLHSTSSRIYCDSLSIYLHISVNECSLIKQIVIGDC